MSGEEIIFVLGLKDEEDSETSLNKIYISLEKKEINFYFTRENKNKQQNKQLYLVK